MLTSHTGCNTYYMYFIMIDDQSEVKRFFNMIFAEWNSWTEPNK